MLAAGCGEDNSDGGADIPEPVPTTVDTEPDEPRTCGTDDECFTYEQAQDIYNRTIKFVAPYFEEVYENPPKPNAYRYIATGETADSVCGQNDSSVLAYCPGDSNIYIGQDSLWEIYSSSTGGDAGIATVLAHEYGHHLQSSAGVPEAQTERETIPSENQADCVAGAWVAWADGKNFFATGEENEILGTLESAASAEGPNRDHGTAGERLEAIQLGFEGGLGECNAFYSRTPLIN